MRTRLFLALAMTVSLVILPAGIAGANNGDSSSATATPPTPRQADAKGGDNMVFYGSGWGHGVGMSQWGSYGLARLGWDYASILEHFYSHSNVGAAPAGSPTQVRVGLTEGRSSLHLGAQNGPVALRFGAPSNAVKFTIPKGSTWTVRTNSAGKFVVTNANGHTYEPIGGPKWRMFATYPIGAAQIRIAEAGHAYGRGYIEFNSYKAGSSFALRAIAVLTPDEYLYGLGEVPNYWPIDALKVQAVAGRTYAFYVIGVQHGGNQHQAGCNCGVYPDSRDQSYLGYDKESDQLGDMWVKAVNQTSGQVVTYQGDIILANYYSTSGGYTEDVENVWFGAAVPYLRSVCDPGDYSAPVGLRTWKEILTRQQVGNALGVGTISSFSGIVRSTNSGRLVWITANGGGLRGSSRKLTGPQFSAALGLMDDKVWINNNRNIEGQIRGEYDSEMCAPGLAQGASFGVGGGAGSVQRFADGSIYQNDAAKAAFWLHGDVYDKYLAFGGVGSKLGLPHSGVMIVTKAAGCREVSCKRVDFDRGRIYDKGQAEPHEVHGRILDYYVGHGAAQGPLGFPTSDVKHLAHGVTRSFFQNGTLTCPGSGPCTVAAATETGDDGDGA